MTLGILQSTRHHTDESESQKNVAAKLAIFFFSKPKTTLSSAHQQYAAAPSEARAADEASASTKKTAAKYKKAPGAPKRFKLAFIFFSANKQKQIRAQMGDNAIMRTADMSKAISVAWKALLPDEKATWEAMAHKDKVRYEFEKSLYNGPWLVPNTRKAKDPNAPKRPMSAFLAFANSRRSTVRKQMPGCNNRELSRALAAQWKDSPDDVRQRYIQEERGKRKAYTEAITEWRKKAEEEKHHERQEREEMALRLAGMLGANNAGDDDDNDDDDHGSLVDESNYNNEEVTVLESFAPSTPSNALLDMRFSHVAQEVRGNADNGTHQSLGSLICPDDWRGSSATDFAAVSFPSSLDPHKHSRQVAHRFPSSDGRSVFDSSSTLPLNHFPAQDYLARTDPFIPYPLANRNDRRALYLPTADGSSTFGFSSTLSLHQFPAQDCRASTVPNVPYPMAHQGVTHHLPSADGRLTSGSSSTLPPNQFVAQHYLARTAPFIPGPLANQIESYASYPNGVAHLPFADRRLTCLNLAQRTS